MTHTLIDISHWQPPVNWAKARKAGIEGVYIKVSQGASYRDPAAAQHYQGAKAAGMLVGFYHFCTNDNGIQQFENFAGAANAIGKTDLPPAMDAEAFTEYQGEIYSYREFRLRVSGVSHKQVVLEIAAIGSTIDKVPVLPMLDDLTPRYVAINNIFNANWPILDLSYPSQDVVDVIGVRLLKYHPEVAIYTNIGSGNRIFTKPVFGKRYRLWVANWGVPVPMIPNVWKDQPYMCWQKDVRDGAEYGVIGKVDVNEWGTALPWPGGDTPPPEPPPEQQTPATILVKQGSNMREFREVL